MTKNAIGIYFGLDKPQWIDRDLEAKSEQARKFICLNQELGKSGDPQEVL